MLFLKDAINMMRSDVFGFQGQACSSECNVCKPCMLGDKCVSSKNTFLGITKLWEYCVCPKGKDPRFHKYECLMVVFKIFGVKKLQLCPREQVEISKLILVQVFEDMQVQNKKGESKKRKVLLVKHLTMSDLGKLLGEKTKYFIKHNFTYRWQAY